LLAAIAKLVTWCIVLLHVLTEDSYETFLATQQAINLEILRRLAAQGVSLA